MYKTRKDIYLNLTIEERDLTLLFEPPRFFFEAMLGRLFPAAPVLRILLDLEENEVLLVRVDLLLEATDAEDFRFNGKRIASVSMSSESASSSSSSSSESPSTFPIISFPSFDSLNSTSSFCEGCCSSVHKNIMMLMSIKQ